MNRILCATAFCLVACSSLSRAEDQATVLDYRQFADELKRLAAICDQLGLRQRAEVCRGWIARTGEHQRCLYLPLDDEFGQLSVADTPAKQSWEKHFTDARKGFARHLFSEFKDLCEQDESAAFRMLWHVLREDPEHTVAGSLAGDLLISLQARPRIAGGRRAVEDLQWPAGSYREITTTHFQILSQADVAKSLEIARSLEQFYVLWAQVFYELWAPPGKLKTRLSSDSQSWTTHDRLRVVLLENRQSYLRLLGAAESQIGISVGYYNPGLQTSFFYPAPEMQATLFHELCHQLMLEATGINPQPRAGLESGIWMIEGIALYMESLTTRGTFWSLGGWECPRMQTARYRAIRDGYWPDWQSFTRAGADDWQNDPSVAQLYTHAAGLTHAFLDRLTTASRDDFMRQLVSVYREDNRSSSLLQHLGTDQQQAKVSYQDLMLVQDQDIEALVRSERQPKDLVLSGSQLSARSWQSLGQLDQLNWLDLAFTNVQDSDLPWLKHKDSLQRLSLEGCKITQTTVELVAELPGMKELDLSSCPIQDKDLTPLRGNSSLEILWLTDTQLTNRALEILATLTQLRTCDVRGTKIAGSAWNEFLRRHPNLEP